MSTAVHGARKANVNHAAAPPTARHPDARTARSAANQPRPMAAPMAILLSVSLATAARMASTACVRPSSLRKNLETEPLFSQVRGRWLWRWIALWSLRPAVDHAAPSLGVRIGL